MEKNIATEKTDWPLSGNRHITDFLEKSLANGRLASVYIFLGPDDLGKSRLAVHFAKSLLCRNRPAGKYAHPCGECSSCRQLKGLSEGEIGFHGDFHTLKKSADKKNIPVEDVREFIRLLSLSSFSDSYKIGIIKGADDLSIEAANALLKTLEEPQSKVVIFLTVSRLEAMPATIISRSQVLRFHPIKTSLIYDYLVDKLDCPRTQAKINSRLSLGRPALAVRFLEEKDFYEAYQEKISIFIDFFRKDINSCLMDVAGLVEKDDEEGKAEKALKVLSIWQGAVRDILLLTSNNGDIIQHEDQREKLFDIGRSFGLNGVLKISQLLKKGEEQVRANVNPKLVLENIAINIK